MLLQSDLAGERSQFAAENKTTSERTFVRFFSTKHGSLRITVGRWLPKETPIRSAPRLEGIYLITITRRGSPWWGVLFFSLPKRKKCIRDHPFVAACSSNLRIRRGPQALLSPANVGLSSRLLNWILISSLSVVRRERSLFYDFLFWIPARKSKQAEPYWWMKEKVYEP